MPDKQQEVPERQYSPKTIYIEGLELAGKSTTCRMLRAHLDAEYRHCAFLPGNPIYDCASALHVGRKLRAAFKRVTGYFDLAIRPLMESGESVLVVSHGNPIRALIAHLQGLSDGEIPAMEISNTAPVVYQAGNSGRLVRVPWTVNTANHGTDGMSKW